MKYPKRSQYKHAKSQYRVRNWAEYEAGLKKRGDLTVWLSDDALDCWRAAPSGKPGGQRTYTDVAIEAALTIRMVFHLPLRQTEGFLRCLGEMLEVDLPIPDHTTLSRRLKKLSDIQFRKLPTDRSTYSSTARDSGFTSDIYGNRQREGLGGSCTSRSMLTQVRSSSHLAVTPNSARILRPHCGNGIATSARSENSDGVDGTRTPATASAAWSKIPCTDTRRSSVEVCEVGPSLDNEVRFNWQARSSTQ